LLTKTDGFNPLRIQTNIVRDAVAYPRIDRAIICNAELPVLVELIPY
jgi:hypothetical protein